MVEYDVNDRGLTARRTQTLLDGRILNTLVETVLPTLRVVPNPFGTEAHVDHLGFVLPVDDTHFRIVTVLRAKDRGFFNFFTQRHQLIDAMTAEARQRRPNDLEAQGSQGPITLHSEEHLATSDRAIITLRRLLEAQLQAIEAERDPIGVQFQPNREYGHRAGGAFITPAPS